MCGRFTLRTPVPDIAEAFGLGDLPPLTPRYNIAPTQPVAAVRRTADGRRELVLLRWGLIPAWADDPAIGNRMINARGESVATKPAFRQAFQRRRCLIVTDGFYEWQKTGTKKQPYYVHRRDDRPFAFAGLWEHWSREAAAIQSCTIITTAPNAVMQPIHDRMPVILAPDDYERWLDPRPLGDAPWAALLRPYPAEALEAYPVSTSVNSPQHDAPECVARIAD